jgi:hypothetical protein
MADKWGIATIVAGAGILAYLIWRGRKGGGSAPSSGIPAPGQSITKTIAPGTTQTVTAWVSPTGQTGYSQVTTTKVSSPAWDVTISYASPSTATGTPTSGGLGNIIAVNKQTGQMWNLSGHHIWWT